MMEHYLLIDAQHHLKNLLDDAQSINTMVILDEENLGSTACPARSER